MFGEAPDIQHSSQSHLYPSSKSKAIRRSRTTHVYENPPTLDEHGKLYQRYVTRKNLHLFTFNRDEFRSDNFMNFAWKKGYSKLLSFKGLIGKTPEYDLFPRAQVKKLSFKGNLLRSVNNC